MEPQHSDKETKDLLCWSLVPRDPRVFLAEGIRTLYILIKKQIILTYCQISKNINQKYFLIDNIGNKISRYQSSSVVTHDKTLQFT